jgi:hypothetical protein
MRLEKDQESRMGELANLNDQGATQMTEIVRAIVGSLLGSDLTYYPRRAGAKGEENIPSKEMLASIGKSLDSLSFESSDPAKIVDIKLLMDRAKDSLEEVKKQTEYQDGKAGRLLTIVAFLTAAVGTVFGKFIDNYSLHLAIDRGGSTQFWVTATYALFGIYLLLVAAGAMVTFHATSTRFVWPDDGHLADEKSARSFLFFQQIIRTTPEAWGSAFVAEKNEFLGKYYKNYVAEAYLIAAKVADKLRYLDPGQRLLLWGIRVLLGLFLFVILTFALVPPIKAEVNPVAPPAPAGGGEKGPSNVGPTKGGSQASAPQAPESSPKAPALPASSK